MQVTTEVLDVEAYEKLKKKPVTLVQRNGKRWLTRDAPMFGEFNSEWGICDSGEMVAIQLFPYLTRGTDPVIALGFAFELGWRARDFVDPNYEIERLHITLGHPVHEYKTPDGTDTLRFWIGFGFVLKEKKCQP